MPVGFEARLEGAEVEVLGVAAVRAVGEVAVAVVHAERVHFEERGEGEWAVVFHPVVVVVVDFVGELAVLGVQYWWEFAWFKKFWRVPEKVVATSAFQPRSRVGVVKIVVGDQIP